MTVAGIRLIGWSSVLAVLAVLALPAIAMQFSSEVNWGSEDFLAMGLMLLALGLGLEASHRFIRRGSARILAAALLVLLFFTTWAELAVGIFS